MMKLQSILSYKLGKTVQSNTFYLDSFTFKNTYKGEFKFGIFYLLDLQGFSRMSEADLYHFLLSHYLSSHSIKECCIVNAARIFHPFPDIAPLLTRGLFASTWD